jgi:hypothetical protein
VPETLAVYVSAVALAEVWSVPEAEVPCQYQVSPAGGAPDLDMVCVPHAFDVAVGAGGADGPLSTDT